MSTIAIHGVPQSNFVWTARLAAAEKGVPHDNVPDLPHEGFVGEHHPLGKIPVMAHGDIVVPESRAIVRYIDTVFDGPPLQSRDPAQAAREEAWTSLVLSATEPVVIREYIFAFLFPGTADGSPDTARADAARPGVERQLKVLDAAAQEGDVLNGGLTLADLWLVPILTYLSRYPVWETVPGTHPALSDGLARAQQRPSFAATAPG